MAVHARGLHNHSTITITSLISTFRRAVDNYSGWSFISIGGLDPSSWSIAITLGVLPVFQARVLSTRVMVEERIVAAAVDEEDYGDLEDELIVV